MEFGTVDDRWSQQDIDRYHAEGQWERATSSDHAARQAAAQSDDVFDLPATGTG